MNRIEAPLALAALRWVSAEDVVERLVAALEDFDAGSVDRDDIAARLESAAKLMEREERSGYQQISDACADIESMHYTMTLADEAPAVSRRLSALRAELRSLLRS